jgi:CubicO group peptidase (beta-lactamase class C family)
MRCCFLLLFLALIVPPSSRADSVDDFIHTALRQHPVPGVAVEIIQDGQCIKRAAYGMANLEWQNAVTLDTVFEIGSISKQFTAAGILLLVQQGKLSVDDKISAHLHDTPASWKDITVRHLLTHTSGLKNYTVLDGFELTKHLTQAQFIQQLGAQPLEFAPGDDWHYCNSGFNLLAYIIENVSRENYWQFMGGHIFTPLGMTSTTNRDPRNVIFHRASGYETNADGSYINRDYDLTDLSGAGAIVSTVDDLAKWNASLDSQKLLNAATEEEMWSPVHLNNGKTHAYGFGWFLDPWKGHQDIGHGGVTSGFSASIQRFPKDHLAVIVLTNSTEEGVATTMAREIALLYFKP